MTKESISYKATKGAVVITGGGIAAGLYFLFLTLFPYDETVLWAMPISICLGVIMNVIGIEILERTCLPSSSNTAKKN